MTPPSAAPACCGCISCDELFAAAQTLAMSRIPAGDRLAIMTNGGGMGILATDTLIDSGGKLAELAPETLQKLDGVLPAGWSHGNPVDIIGDAPAERFAAAARSCATIPMSTPSSSSTAPPQSRMRSRRRMR